MALGFTGSSLFNLEAIYKNPGNLTTPTEAISVSKSVTWTGSNGNRFYYQRIALSASTPVTTNLYGAITDAFGNTLNFASIRQLIFENRGTTGQNVTVTGNFMTGSIIGATGSLTLPPGLTVFSSPIDGFAVTDTTKEAITLTPGAYAVDVDLVLIGVSA